MIPSCKRAEVKQHERKKRAIHIDERGAGRWVGIQGPKPLGWHGDDIYQGLTSILTFEKVACRLAQAQGFERVLAWFSMGFARWMRTGAWHGMAHGHDRCNVCWRLALRR